MGGPIQWGCSRVGVNKGIGILENKDIHETWAGSAHKAPILCMCE